MLQKVSIALASALLTTLAAIAVLVSWTGISPLGLLHGPRQWPELGFRATFFTPGAERCGFGGGYQTAIWWDGPHGSFDEREPDGLARDSLAWFEEIAKLSPYAELDEAELQLTWRSADASVELTFDPQADPSWERQIRAWFERFPPEAGDEGPPVVEGGLEWSLRFAERGAISGWVRTVPEALEHLRLLAAEPDPTGFFGAPVFALGRLEEVAPRTVNCYSVHTGRLDELDELPRRLDEQAAAATR